MKHAEVMSIPVGSKIVVSERTDRLDRANLTNSVVAVLESHDNFAKAYWNGLYWRDMNDQFTKADSKSRTKHYFVSTEMPQDDGTTIKVKTLVKGQHILGAYNAETQKLWDDEAKNREANQLEQERIREVKYEAEQRGYAEATLRTTSVVELVEGLIGRTVQNGEGGVSVSIRCNDVNFTDSTMTHAEPVLSGQVSLDYKLFEQLVERMYAQLDAR